MRGDDGLSSEHPGHDPQARAKLTKYAWLAIAAAIATISLKTGAWWLTGSVGLLSDAAESVVNLMAAIVALFALRVAAQPADKNHHYGHAKAEYFSAAVEGQMIFVAAVAILWTSVDRFMHPQPIENVGVGLLISVVSSVINGAVAVILLRAGRQYRSTTLIADGRHLMTDVWTSVGVVGGVLVVALTVDRLDPVIAFLVGLNIIRTGWQLLQESAEGLMDTSLSKAENAAVAATLERYVSEDVTFHGLRTRVAGHARFADVHLLVPGEWSVHRAHDIAHEVELVVAKEHDGLALTCHIEPFEDPRAHGDYAVEVPIRRHDEL